MIEQPITISNKLGLHARAAAKLVNTAGQFSSQVMLRKESQEVNAKSIMGVMMLAAGKGTELTMYLKGQDEQEAANALADLIDNRFGEPE